MAKPPASQKIPTVLIYMLFSINKNPNPSPIGEKFGLDCCGEPPTHKGELVFVGGMCGIFISL